jgi:hypothetical protein
MAEKILDAGELLQLQNEIEEAAGLLLTVIELGPIDGATPTTHAMEELTRKAGWLLDRCIRRLGGAGVAGPEWTDWCGGYPEIEENQRLAKLAEMARAPRAAS